MAHRTHSPKVKNVQNSNSDINVTPLIDVVLVLLIIFMVVTPLLEKEIEIRVPDTEQTQDDQTQNDQIVVGLSPNGDIAINTEKVAEEEYVPKLAKILAAKARADRLVFFMPDEKANYGKLVAALDGAKKAGAEILGMMTELTPPPEGGQPGAPAAPPTAGGAPGSP